MFLEHPPTSDSVDVLFANDLQSEGYVMNLTRLWSWRPEVADAFGDARATLLADCELTEADVQSLRDVGLSDRAIFEATAHIAFRLAFSTVNDALAAAPDAQVVEAAPVALRKAVTFGRAPHPVPS